MNETLTPKERLTKKHLNFLSKIEKQVSPQEFEAIRASLEDSREIPVSEINKLYEERVSQAKNEVSPKAKEEILRVSGAFDQLTKKSSSDQRRSVPAALAASSYRPLMIPQSPGDFDSFDEASSKSEELTSQKVPWELEQEPRVLRPEDYELQEYSPEKVDLEPFEDDSLFVIVSKAYKRNIRRINRPKAEKP